MFLTLRGEDTVFHLAPKATPALLTAVVVALSIGQICAAADRVLAPVVTVTNAPAVQLLVPGFVARECQIEANNINNLVFTPDGRLFGLCYNGDVLLLKDTDGDGLVDRATKYFDNAKNDILPSIGMAWGPGGLYIASQGRVLRLREQPEGGCQLETVASGWVPPTGKAGSDLDAVGLAVDSSGTIYFGLGCDNWHEAYRVDNQTGKSSYNIHSERGTIVRLSPDGKHRESICTGLRFTVSLAFNRAGDLFCTDQEGATWLPNGNPFDELLHIQPGRHYGFPPRHPRYLPSVIDEPSLFDYGPQHQSTCSLHFNEPCAGSNKLFGPRWWEGDGIISGESRGKLWRTKLVKTSAGYVARTDLIACLAMLTVDAVPTPDGGLLVACHSGKPDWGTGPQGKGKIFKIAYAHLDEPQPVFAYPVNETTTRVVFDRSLPWGPGTDALERTRVSMGKYVSAGERYETFRPGYRAVKNQKTMPRYELAVGAIRFEPQENALLITTSPRDEAVNYALMLPPMIAKKRAPEQADDSIDLLMDLTGVEAAWLDAKGRTNWAGWLPCLDLAAAREFSRPSHSHRDMFERLRGPGILRLRTRIDLWRMLRAATQPDSQLDFDYPPEVVTLHLKAGGPLKVLSDAAVQRRSGNEASITVKPLPDEWLTVEAQLSLATSKPGLDVSWSTAEDPRPRPLVLARQFVPWAKPYRAALAVAPIEEVRGGDWERGRKVFYGQQVACYKCHAVHGEGGTIGPDLSNLLYRDYASVMRDITEPSATIAPEHVAYNVELTDGSSATGVLLKNDSTGVELGMADGEARKIERSNVASMKASTVSLMPEGLLKNLTAEQQKDLLTFLLMAPPSH